MVHKLLEMQALLRKAVAWGGPVTAPLNDILPRVLMPSVRLTGLQCAGHRAAVHHLHGVHRLP
jgi:hypothetical protein